MKICVLTACQMEGLVAALQILFPQHEIEGFHTYRLLTPDHDAISERMRGADLLFILPLKSTFGAFSKQAVASLGPQIQFVPQVAFPAFQPDILYVSKGKGWVQSPLTDYNSNIAVAAYLNGLGIGRTLSLYNSLIYEAMGYFDIVARCRATLIAEFARYGLDIVAAAERWSAQSGCFMYSINHPKPFVLADVALLASRAAGLPVPERFPCPEMMPDRLGEWVVWPVFPEIARRLGRDGHTFFKAPPNGRTNVFDLETFVAGSFRLYDSDDVSAWTISRRLAASKARLAALVQ